MHLTASECFILMHFYIIFVVFLFYIDIYIFFLFFVLFFLPLEISLFLCYQDPHDHTHFVFYSVVFFSFLLEKWSQDSTAQWDNVGPGQRPAQPDRWVDQNEWPTECCGDPQTMGPSIACLRVCWWSVAFTKCFGQHRHIWFVLSHMPKLFHQVKRRWLQRAHIIFVHASARNWQGGIMLLRSERAARNHTPEVRLRALMLTCLTLGINGTVTI